MERQISNEEYLREKNKIEIDLKDFRKLLKEHGYKAKVKTLSFGKVLDIVDMGGNFIVGSSANVYTHDKIEKHGMAFKFVREYRVMDNGERVIM